MDVRDDETAMSSEFAGFSDDSQQDHDFIPYFSSEGSSSSNEAEAIQLKKTRKRVRKERAWKRNRSKMLRNTGKEHFDGKGVRQNAKTVQPLENHNCRYSCSQFTEEARKALFDKYWALGSWDLQTTFLTSCMETFTPKRPYQNAVCKKKVSVCLKLQGKRVCKTLILKTLDISKKRYDNVLKKRHETGIASTDNRGKHTPANKVSDEQNGLVEQHIQSFPKYSSHYSRAQNPETKYLPPGLNVRKLYTLYSEFCAANNEVPLKESYYRHVFNTKFNLRFKKPHSDTCEFCDILENRIKNCENTQIVSKSKFEKELHLRKAEKAKYSKKEAKQLATDNPSTVKSICFDLQKTLQTPVLTCSKVFYLRQLWTYNFGIHDLGTHQASMFMWYEGQAKRGSQEIGSCLLRYVQELPASIRHLIAFSDNAGGQNKNNNIIRYWMYIVRCSNIETVDHKFMICGHTYMECDRDFGLIEMAKKKYEYVFVPDDWVNIVAKASRKFTVFRMGNEDFKSIENMSKNTKAFKGIRPMQWLRFKKETPFTLYYKNTLSEDMPFESVSLQSTARGRPCFSVQLGVLYDQLVPIKKAKYNDLQKLLSYLPPVHHEFYKSLKYNAAQQSEARYPAANSDLEETAEEFETEHLTDLDSDE